MNVRIGVLLVPLLVPFLLLAIWLARGSQGSRRALDVDPSRHAALLATHRTAVRWRWAGLILGVAAAAVTAVTAAVESHNIGAMLSPTIFGLFVIAGVVVGELTTTPRRQGVRSAALETRAVGDYVPRRLGALVAATTVGLGALLVTTTLMGSADDQGRAGRFLVRQCTSNRAGSNGPWPGEFYSVPLGIAIVLGLLVAAVALRTVVLRPRSSSDPDLIAADDVLRRQSAEAVVAATGVMVAASLCGVALVAGIQLHRIACAPESWTILAVALLAVATLMLFLGPWCLALLLAGRRFPPVKPADAAPAEEPAHR